MSYTVAQQTRELGIRMALGAESSKVLRLVLNKGLILAGVGIALGIGGALALGKVVATQLFQTKAADPIVFLGVSLGLVVVALFATLVPARRATRVDPMVALRSE
jgi:ABC-type antimicrobial peptide transport system permease subunit